MAVFFSQTNWLGIDFAELGVELDPSRTPDSNFYKAFYLALTQKYADYESLPVAWKSVKLGDSLQLANLISKPEKILSYGCGVGFLESELRRILENNLYVTDFSDVVLKYNLDFRDTFIELGHIDSHRYSHIILNQVSYALTDLDLEALIKNLGSLLSPGGKMLIGYSPQKSLKIHRRVAQLARVWALAGVSFGYLKQKNQSATNSQGWGWHRTIFEMNEIIRHANLTIIETHRFKTQIVVELQSDGFV